MTRTIFELYTLKDNQWQLDCTFNEKGDATDEAWRLVKAGHFGAVKVVEETYDEANDTVKTKTIFHRTKNDVKKPAARSPQQKREYEAHARLNAADKSGEEIKKINQSSSSTQLGVIVVVLCVVLLSVLAGAFFLID